MKKIKPLLIIILVYITFFSLFVRPKFGPQAEKIPSQFESGPPLELNLNKTSTGIKKEDLTPEQLTAFERVTAEYFRDTPISINAVNEEDFGNTSLGCPVEGTMYAEVITPSFKFDLEDESGKKLDYRISKDLKIIKECSRGGEIPTK
ncbi:hypothetical protein GW755_04070 [bacterium]|nr:hypothetical protein [bacterium]